jgi:hypothetical protein
MSRTPPIQRAIDQEDRACQEKVYALTLDERARLSIPWSPLIYFPQRAVVRGQAEAESRGMGDSRNGDLDRCSSHCRRGWAVSGSRPGRWCCPGEVFRGFRVRRIDSCQ